MGFKLMHQTMAGEQFVRCLQVVIDNRAALPAPVVTFHQERVVQESGGALLRAPLSPATLRFDPAAKIPVIDPDTGEATGDVVTHADVFKLVYSAYVASITPPALEDPTVEEAS